ncbi:MAG: response regulator [Lachnospiraceae bacterium]|nr:response regulator [Lachnospiraceae bacterium]
MGKERRAQAGMRWLFYILFMGVMVYLVFGTISSYENSEHMIQEGSVLNVAWERVYADNTRKQVSVPNNLDAKRGETVVLEAVLPEKIEEGNWLCFRSSQQDMRIYINEELRREYSTKETRTFGKTSASAYVFTKVYTEDAGKILRVEFSSNSIYAGTANQVYYGDRLAIWDDVARQYAPECLIAFLMVVLAITCIVFSNVIKFRSEKKIMLDYLGWGILMVAIWVLSENRLRQLIFPDVTVVSNLAYFCLMLLPLPFIAYINDIQEYRYRVWYYVIYWMVLLDFIICTVLQVLNIRDFFENILFMHGSILVVIILGVITTGIDIKEKRIESYKYVAIGLGVLMISAIAEIVKVYLNNGQMSGSLICLGMIFLLIMAASKTGKDVMNMDRQMQSALSDNASKVSFLAKMSHEIRTPINTLIGMNEMIARENQDKELETYIKNAQSAGRTLLALVNDILDFSRMESGHLNLTENVYQLASLVNDEVHMIQARAEKKFLEVVVNVDEKLPSYLYGDEVRIKQIISNLLSNAVKYTEKGTVTFSVSGDSSDEGEFFLRIAVADTGVGIQEKDLSKIFESFSRLEEKKYQNIEGTGLGLNLIKTLVEEMEGEIKVRSIYGKGSLFTVVLPQKVIDATPVGMRTEAFREEKEQLEKYQSGFVAPHARILAVDDNEMNHAVVKGFLKRTQVQLDTVLSGTDCLELCKENAYDIILMDHMMPEPDGIETLRLIRQQENGKNHRTPVIVLTANAVAGSREMYLSEGFAEYLSKPISPDKLENALRKFLPENLILPADAVEDEKKEPVSSRENLVMAEELPIQEHGRQISMKLGMSYCNGDEEMYFDLLDAYYKQGLRYVEILEKYFAEKDWKNYAVTAHALKSTSLNVGARSFSDEAKNHEMAGKEEKEDWIIRNWESFYQSLKEVLQEAADMLQENAGEEVVTETVADSQLTELSQEEYMEQCRQLLELIRNYEMSASEEKIQQMKTQTMEGLEPEKVQEMLAGLQEAIDGFDYAGAEELLETWMNGVVAE